MFPPRSLTFYHSQILQMPNPKSRYSKLRLRTLERDQNLKVSLKLREL